MLSDDTQCSNRSLDLISNSRYYQPYNSYNVSSENLVLDQLIIHLIIFFFIIPILKSLVVPVIWLALIGAIYSRIATFFALNRIFFPANEATVTNKIARKWKKKSIMWQILQLSFTKRLSPPPKKGMNLISNRLSTASVKYLNWPSPVFGQFQNGCNKVVTEPRVVQFWSKIILVI